MVGSACGYRSRGGLKGPPWNGEHRTLRAFSHAVDQAVRSFHYSMRPGLCVSSGVTYTDLYCRVHSCVGYEKWSAAHISPSIRVEGLVSCLRLFRYGLPVALIENKVT